MFTYHVYIPIYHVYRFLNVIAIVASFNQALSRGLVCDCENFVDIRFQLYCSMFILSANIQNSEQWMESDVCLIRPGICLLVTLIKTHCHSYTAHTHTRRLQSFCHYTSD